jgi:hypothetical protein
MTTIRERICWLAAASLAAASIALTSCGGSKQDAASTANNVAPLVVNGGPPGTGLADVPFVSVTICVPGTKNCQTIDYLNVDTGSSGLRVISSVLLSGLALPQQTATTGEPLVECMQFASGYTWGSVRLADVEIAGEVAAGVPIQVIGDPAFSSVPSDCSSIGPSNDDLSSLGSNGLLGINQIVPDCGDACANPNDILTGAYYSCTGSACSGVAVADAVQVSNPIASFRMDNNGAILRFPTVAAAGAATLSGSLIFGIGTQANNDLGGASVLTVDPFGNFSTVFQGKTLAMSFIDSGSNAISFNDSSIPECASADVSGFYCPTSTLTFAAQNTGLNGVTTTVSFSVGNAETLFDNVSDNVFDDLAAPGIDNDSFDWGLPFFFGRSVYVALDGASTPGGKGPYFAY